MALIVKTLTELDCELHKIDKHTAPTIIPLTLSLQEINDYINNPLLKTSKNRESQGYKDLLYRVPPLVNNQTQKTHRNVFSLDEYASWKKENGGLARFLDRQKSKVGFKPNHF